MNTELIARTSEYLFRLKREIGDRISIFHSPSNLRNPIVDINDTLNEFMRAKALEKTEQ